MSHGQESHSPKPKPSAEFGLTEREQLFDRVNHERLLEMIADEATTVHEIEESYNNYGRFLFVTLSKPGQNQRICVTFWGMGFHEGRERWLVGEWFWYLAHPRPQTLASVLAKEEAEHTIRQRQEMAASYAQQETQTQRGQVFEMLADLTDEDGAWAEMEDLPWWLLGEDE